MSELPFIPDEAEDRLMVIYMIRELKSKHLSQ